MSHHQVRTILFVPSPRTHLLNERQRFPILPHRRQPHLTGTPQRGQQRFDTQVFIQFVAARSVRYNVHGL